MLKKKEQNQTPEHTKGRFLKKNKKRKKWMLAAAAVVLIAALLLIRGKSKQEVPQLDLTDTTVLNYTDLENSISATGTVESAHSRMVYSTAAYQVMAVHVEVGDRVQEGQLLAELDGESIQNQINSQEITMEVSSQSSGQQVKAAQDNYNNFKSGLDQGLNATLNGAKTQVQSAYEAYVRAKNTYERYKNGLDVGENTTLLGAESALRSAESGLETARDAYDTACRSYRDAQQALEKAEDGWLTAQTREQTVRQARDEAQQMLEALQNRQNAGETGLEQAILDQQNQVQQLEAALTQAQAETEAQRAVYEQALPLRDQARSALDAADRSLENAQAAYDTQKSTYHATVTAVDDTLADYQTSLQSAWETYQDAQVSLKSTQKSVNEQLQSYENNLTSAQIGASTAVSEEGLRQLQDSLDDTKITAPCAGTITAVYAEVGSSGSGLLFVIEDVDNLVVETTVKGYDVGTVQEGMPVVIRSDATGDTKMDGVISSIAPTSNKNAMGQTDTTGDAVFAAEVAVTSQNTGLRIGMEAQLDYIVARESHVLTVPYDAVYENDQGQTCVLMAVEQKDGRYAIQELPITTGIDDDLDLAISGDGVEEGMRVINEPDSYLHLLGQTVTAGTGLQSGLPMGGMMVGGA